MKIPLQMLNRLFKLTLLLMIPLAVQANGFNSSVKRVLTKSYTVNDGAGLSVNNKYGKIVLHSWNNNIIKATVTITGFGNSDEEARSIAESVNIATSQSGSGGDVSFQTQYHPGSGGGSSFLSKLFSSSKDNKKYVNIDYDIYLPKSSGNINLSNNYGDIVTDDLSASLAVAINYCNYHLGKVAGKMSLDMNYSDGSIEGAKNINVSANYCTLHINNIQAGSVHSNYSHYDIGKAGNLQLSGNYCDYRIDEVANINGHTTYTDYKIGSLTGSGDMKIIYGNFSLKNLSPETKTFSLKGTYADFAIGLSENNSLHLKANLTYGDVSTGGLNFKNVNRSENGSHTSFEGTTTGKGNMTELTVEGTQTDLKLKTH